MVISNDKYNVTANGTGPANGSNYTNGYTHTNGTNGSLDGTNGYAHSNGASGLNGTNGSSNGTHAPDAFVPYLGNGDYGKTVQKPIAIVGMGMRLPGGIEKSDDFWKLLVEKRDGRIPVPESRYNVDSFYSAHGKPGTVKTQHGHFLHQNLKHLDSSFFTMTRAETEKLDPQARLLLEVSREALENAGETNWRGKNIACYVGVFGEDWQDIHQKDSQDAGMYRVTGYGDFLLGNRISYEYDLKGPSLTVKTGCSSSLICLHMAVQALSTGECDAAIAAGTNLIMSPTMTVAMSEQGVLSDDARCKSFDSKANGYARGEAINVLYVKRLEDALRDGNPIQAVIRATATNCDGKTPGISHPSSESHERLLRSAFEFAGIEDLSSTALIECHGTGTSIGDPLEARAVANVFGDKGIYIGSHKPNVGHSEGASGITGVIKTVLALQNKTIPPQINFSEGNVKIPFDKLKVPLDPVPWPAGFAERACVNAFGLGGANATVILESAESFGLKSSRALPATGKVTEITEIPRLLVLSANHTDSLKTMVNNYKNYVTEKPDNLADLAYTLGARREHLPYRTFLVTDGKEFVEGTEAVKPNITPKLNFVFTGQGAQWAGMARELISDYPSVRRDIEIMDRALQALPFPPTWTILGELHKAGQDTDEIAALKAAARIGLAEFAQPLCTAVQVAIINLLRTWGIKPDAVVGHSSGEIACAYAANAITIEEAITIAYYRGHVTKQQKRPGGMVAVGLSSEEVSKYLIEGTVVACENSPSSVTISGDLNKLEIVSDAIKKANPSTFVRSLKVEMAYHSHHMVEVGEAYQALLQDQVFSRPPTVPFYSSVTGKLLTEQEDVGPAYWRRNLESPVLFSTSTHEILKDQPSDSLFFEIGPHSALQGPLRQIFKSARAKNVTYVSALSRNTNGTHTLLSAVGQLFVKGLPIKFDALSPGSVLTDLPPYPWYHNTEYWDESRISREWRLREFPHHDILGNRVTESSAIEPSWRNMLRLDEISWIRDHQIAGDTVFPGAGYIAMVGEAVRQITGKGDYTIRQMSLSAAMVMTESHATEVVTSLKPLRLTTALDSAWYEFSVISHNGTSWTKHCSGQVRGGYEHEPVSTTVPQLPRLVSKPLWYHALRKVGLEYGPRFQGMEEISTSTAGNTAAATIVDHKEPSESRFELHPSTIDLCVQLFAAAAANGLPRELKTISVPTWFESLYIAQPESDMRMIAKASVTPRGIITGDGIAMCNGKVAVEMKGLKLFPLDDDKNNRGADPHAAASLHWQPDFDFLNNADLVRASELNSREFYWPVERLATLTSIESHYQLSNLDPTAAHLKNYQSWLAKRVEQAKAGELQLVTGAEAYVNMTSEERLSLIKTLTEQIMDTPTRALGIALTRIFNNIKEIFAGTVDPFEILLQDDILTQLYNMGDRWSFKPFFKSLSHSRPWLRVLEIGAGTGSLTAQILKYLFSENGERLYSTYHFTDISPGFIPMAKERFAEFSNIEFSVLDISKDPTEQGFEAGSYDLIIAANVLHATPSLSETLSNVHKLLRPDGILFLDELFTEAKWINYIMGTLSGWWLGEADARTWEPYVSPERWTAEFDKIGFSKPTVVYDDEVPYQSNTLIVTSPVPPKQEDKEEKAITILTESSNSSLVQDIVGQFQKKGYVTEISPLRSEATSGRDVIAVLDMEEPFLQDISEERYKLFLDFVQSIKFSSMLWVLPPSQINCEDPRYAQSLGLMRVIRNELAIDVATLELDEVNPTSANIIYDVYSKFQRRDKSGDFDPDFEFAVSKGTINIPRFHWFSVNENNTTAAANKEDSPKRLEIAKRGFLNTLGWVQRPITDLVEDQVEIDVRSVGMNFKDVLIAMGIVDGHVSEGNGLGCECSGVIRRIGPDVTNVKVGDRVVVFSGGSYSTSLTTTSKLVAKMPDNLSFEDGATMPCVYSTVIYSLIHHGRLSKGQTVLIHSACGGIGIAALQISKMLGATIYATVGNEEKKQYLVDTFGLPRDHIFNSRTPAFLGDVMKKTNGRGVDVVLNSLSGELLHASWQCVAKHGKMVEIGKRDFIGRARLDMGVFESNRAFFGVDFAEICAERPSITQSVLEECMGYYARGDIGPIHPITRFNGTDIESAFRFMQKGTHIGKIVVNMPDSPKVLPAAKIRPGPQFRADRSYLLIGGLGGLGKAISSWMVEHGARSLVYLSRSAGQSAEDQLFFKELKTQGCDAVALAGSVNIAQDVEQALALAPNPVGGILQMSMVLRDGPLPEMTHENWEIAVKPKVQGTWNLHNATLSSPLDFFVLFSSSSGLVGQRGQANYASANTFLDAFVQFRHKNGLPASVLNIGPVEGVGYLNTNKVVLDQFRATSVYTLQEQDLLDSLQMIIGRSTPSTTTTESTFVNNSQVGIGLRMTTAWATPSNRCIWKRDRRMSVYRNIEEVENANESSGNSGLRQFLAAAESDIASLRDASAVEFLATEVGTVLYGFLLLPLEELDINKPIASLGVDSLVAIELRNWCRHKLGVEITVLEILDFKTLDALGEVLAQRLYVKFGGQEEHVRESFLQMKAP